MVLKRSKLNKNTGNSFYKKSLPKQGCIMQWLLTSHFTQADKFSAKSKFESKFKCLGNIEPSYNYNGGSVVHSLDKHKRWTIPNLIKDIIYDHGENFDEYILSLHERKDLHSEGRRFRLDTTSYYDSFYARHESKAKKTYSSLTDLKLNCHYSHEGILVPENAQDKRNHRCNSNTRGVQRLYHHAHRNSQNVIPDQPTHFDVMSGNIHPKILPEIRYEIITSCDVPDTRLLSKKSRFSGYVHRASGYHEQHRKTLSCDEWDLSNRYHEFLKDCHAELEYDYEYEDLLESDLQEADSEKLKFTLSDFICMDGVKKKYTYKHRKPKKKHNSMKDTYKNISPNTATSTSPLFYGKGKVLYETHAPIEKEKDNEKVGKEIESNTTTLTDSSHVQSVESDTKQDLADFFVSYFFLKDTVDSLALTHSSVKIGNCLPARYFFSYPSLNKNTGLMIWEKPSKEHLESLTNYWVRLQTDQSIDHHSLQDAFDLIMKVNRSTYSFSVFLSETQKWLDKERTICNQTNNEETKKGGNSLLDEVIACKIETGTLHHVQQSLEVEENVNLDCSSFEKIACEDLVFGSNLMSDNQESYCETCFVSSADGTMLLPCEHYFCDNCWHNYVIESMHQGHIKIECQAYKCRSYLNDIMVMSYVSPEKFNQWQKRRLEFQVRASDMWRWCPSGKCDLLVHVPKSSLLLDDNMPVMCACSEFWCFGCQQEAHWPASCKMAHSYRKLLIKFGEERGKKKLEPLVFYVNVKKCPRCKQPINKNGGCRMMHCICGHGFCWDCLLPLVDHGFRTCAMHLEETTLAITDENDLKGTGQFYKASVQHRHKRFHEVSNYEVQKRLKLLYLLQTGNDGRNGLSMCTDDIENYCRIVKEHLYQIREIHFLMEYLYVVSSNLTTKKQRLVQKFLSFYAVEFMINKMEEILLKSPTLRDIVPCLPSIEKRKLQLQNTIKILSMVLLREQKNMGL